MNISVTTSWQQIALSGKLLQNIGTATVEVAKANTDTDGLRLRHLDILSGTLWGQDVAHIRLSDTSSATLGQVRLV
jgi:hypothetical protein